MSKAPRHRRPLIEALEPRLLFSATADIAVFDDGNSDVQYLAQAAQDVDLVSIYMPDERADVHPLMMQDTHTDIPQVDSVIFVDTAVENYQTLVNDIEAALNDETVAIIYLDKTKEGLVQISDYLAGASGISAVHIISHGVAGSVQLGTQVLNENNIAQYQQSLSGWKNSLGEDADILLYGCDVAANQSGINLLRQLSDITGADVAASNDLTGNAANADWDLETRVGQIETASIFTSNQSMQWQGVLADVVHLYSGVATNEQAIPTSGNVMQGIQLTSSQTVDRIQVMLANHGTSSSSVQMIVHEHSYNGTAIATATVNTSSLGSSLGWVNFDFAQKTFNAYTIYWIEFKTNNGADNLIGIGYINTNVITSEFVVNNSADGNKDMAIAVIDVENRFPTVANAIPNQTATEEAWFSYTFPANTFNDVDGDTLSYAATLANGNPLPSWLSFNAGTRTFSGVPDDGDVGTISVKVTANDGKGGTVDDTFDVVINNVNDNPFLNIPVPNQNATEDSVFSYTFPANTFGDGDVGTTFTYTAELAGGGILPAWLNFDSAARTFSGTPANGDVGTISIKITANDGAGATATDNFDIVIANTNDAPTVANQIPNQTATENVLFNYTFAINTFNDQDVGNTLTYTAQIPGGTPLPAWLSFDSATRTFSGTPSNGDVGTISIEVRASDGTATVSDFFDLVIQNVGSSNVVYETSGPSTDTQVISSGVPFFQSFYHDSPGATYTIDSIVLQLVKDPAASAQTITVTLLSGAHNGTVIGTANISSATIGTTLAWKAFDFTNKVLTDNQVYFIKIESSSVDGLVKAAIHNTNVYPNGSYHSSGGTADITRDVAFQVSSGANIDPVIANPIPNQNATEDSAFNFQFAANTFNDADVGDVLTYTATMADGSALPSWLSFNAATRTFSGTPTNSDVGTISIKVTAADGQGGTSATDTFDLVVANTNDAPTVANPIPNQNAAEDSVFNFTFASNTFADQDVGNTLSYSAQLAGGGALPSWLSFDAATRTFSGTPTNAHVGTVSIDVIANDGNGGTITDTFNIVVANTNDAPTVANAIPNQNATEDAAFNFQFAANTFSDPDVGDTFTYSAQLAGGGALPSWLSFNAATRTFSGTPANGDVGSFSVDVIASDGNGGTVTDTFSITVANVNDAPGVSIALTDYYTNEQVAVNLHGTGISISDVDSTNITLTLTGPGANSQLTASVGTTGVSIFSGNGSPTLVLTGTLTQINTFLAGNNGGTLTYRMAGDTPIATATLTISASDGSLSGSDTATVHITAVNDAPVNTVPGAQVTNEDIALVFSAGNGNQIQVNDVDVASGNLEITLSVTNGTLTLAGTTGLSFTTGDGTADSTLVFTGTLANINVALATLTFNPTANYNGAAVLSLTTSDLGNTGSGGTLTDTDTVNITINAVNDAPTVANIIPNQNATEDTAFNFQFAANTFADPDVSDTLIYSVQLAGGGSLPSWLTFNAATRTFSGTPANGDVGTISIDVTADDGNGGTITDTFNIVIANTNDAPTVANAIPNQNATEDSAFNFQFAANTFADVDAGATLTYSAQLAGGGSLPSWLTFNAATRTFSGTPANGDVGTISIDVIADDGNGGTVTDTFNIVIANTNDAPTIANAIPNQNATEDSAFNFQFAANTFADVDAGATLTYSAQLAGGGSLPSWLSFNAATRTFSGTPANGDVGTISIDVTADDGNGGTVTDTFNIVIANTNDAPTVANAIPNQNATEDSAFSFQFAANTFADVDAGATLTYSAQLAGGGSLPSWLTFNAATRTFSGTPANGDVGTLSIDVIADDGNGGTVTDTFNIVIANTNDAPTVANAIPNQNATENSAFNFQFAANTFADVDAGATLTYSAQLAGGGSLPSWLTFNAATRTFSGTPANGDVGTISIDVTADDGNGGTVTDTFNIVIANTNDAPTVANAIPNQNAAENSSFNFQFAANTFADIDAGTTLTYSAQLAGGGALPSWLSFDAITRTFSGSPATADVGTLNIEVTANDGNGGSVADVFTLTVSGLPDTEYIDTGDGNAFIPVTSGNQIGQSFSYDSASATYTVNEISLYLARYDNAAAQTITVELRDAWSGAVLGSDSIASSQISRDGFGWHSFNFSNVALNDQQSYVIRISSTGSDGLVLVSRIGGNTFADGAMIENGVPDATGWDLAFKVAKDDGSNAAPVLDNPIADRTINAEAPFNFVVPANTFSDPDANDTITYRAQLAGGGSLGWLGFNESTRTFSGTPHWHQAGTITVELIATDNHGVSTSEFFDITVVNTNIAPTVANPIPDQIVNEDSPLNFQFASNTFADADAGTTFTYSAQLAVLGGLPPWLAFDAATRTFSGTPANGDVGTWTIEVTANDGFGGIIVDTFVITVANTNDAPVIANPIGDQGAIQGVPFNFQFVANTFADIDVGDTLTYSAQLAGGGSLPSWLSFNAATRTFSGTPANGDVGTISIDVIADDGNGGTLTDTFNIVIANTNDAPTVANAIPNQNATEDSVFNFQFAANTFADVDVGATLTYSAQLVGGSALPSWLSFDPVTRTFSGTPLNGDVGTISIDVIADDGNGGTVTDTFDIVIANTNDAPTVANAIPNQNATEDSVFNFQFAANTFADVDAGAALAYSAQLAGGGSLPLWLTFNAATRTFSGTPTNGDIGTISIDVIANDGNGGIVSDTFDIAITNTNDAPTVANVIPNQNATEDTVFNFQFAANTFADVDVGATLTYSAQLVGGSALPSWLSFDPVTRTFSGTPANGDVGTISINVIANDGNGGTVTDTFDIVIANTNDAPTIANAIPDRSATENVAFNFQLAANTFADIDVGDTLTYIAQLAGGGALPSWLSFDAATRTFSGIPANGDVGTVSINVIADDGNGGTVTDTFDIVIANANGAPTVANAIPDQNATEDTAFNFQFAANTFADADAGATLAYSAQLAGGAALPSWLSFNAATRTFSGTPANSDVGTISITVIADDDNGGMVTDTFNIVIANTNDAPTVANTIPNQNISEDTAFNFQFAANTFADMDAGDALTYTAQLAGGGVLPSWLSFDPVTRTFSGIPTNSDVGTISIDVTANDGNGGTVTDTFNIIIANTNDAPTVDAPLVNPVATEDLPFTLSFPLTMFNDLDVGDSLGYSAQLANGQPLPGWLHFDANTLTFSGTPLNSDVGNLAIQLIASDGEANVSFQFLIRVEAVNDNPVANTPAIINTLEDAVGDQLDLFATFSDEETPANQLQYSVVSNSNPALVSGITVDAQSGKLIFSYGVNQFGSSDLIIRAQDANGAFVDTPLRINVASVNDAPVSTGITDIRVAAGTAPQQIDLHKIFADIEQGTALKYSLIANTNPAIATNVQWDQVTGVMTIVFASATGGETFITLRAQDDDGSWVETRFKVTVLGNAIPEPEVPKPPVIPPVVPPLPEVPTTPPIVTPPTPPEENGHIPIPDNNGEEIDVPGTGGQVVSPLIEPNDLRDLPNDKSSRDYARIEAELAANNVPVITLTASSSLVSLITTDAGFAPWEAEDFDNEVRRIRDQMDVAMEEEQDRRAVVAGITFSVTTGLLIWSLRASSLLLTLMSMLPLWRGLDPLPILDEVNKRKKELEQQRKDRAREDKSSKEVGYLFDHAQHKQPGQ